MSNIEQDNLTDLNNEEHQDRMEKHYIITLK